MKQTVHCLDCDATYPEQEPLVEICPECGNSDTLRTVYLQDEEVSNCCGERIYENTDICSVCHEHCEPVTEDEA